MNVNREDLLGYLLGALDDDEEARVRDALQENPALFDELEQLRRHLEPLESTRVQYQPPAGLAARTVAHIVDSEAAMQSATAYRGRLLIGQSGWSMPDLVVSMAVCMVATMLLFPALLNGRFHQQIEACQWNLANLGNQLISYSERQPDRSFPGIGTEAPNNFAANVFVELNDCYYLPQRTSKLVCPASDLADQYDSWKGIVTREEVVSLEGLQLEQRQRDSAGTYAVYLGGVDEEGFYRVPRNWGRSFFVLMADMPSLHLPSRLSANHAGRGQNLLFESGRTTFVKQCLSKNCGDDPFRNYYGYLEAGVGSEDSVVGFGSTSPFLQY